MMAYLADLSTILLPNPALLAAFALATIVLAITPGPDMALFLSRALNFGRAHGFAALAGACSGILIHTLLVALGISVLIATAPTAFLVLKIVGALYLIWLAIGALRAGNNVQFNFGKSTKQPSLKKSYLTGVGINLLNPKIVLFFMTFLPQFVVAGDPYAAHKLFTLGILFIVISLPLTVAMIAGADWLSKALQKSKWIGRALNYSFAAVFTAFAATILTAQARH
ncbi:LysE family translocator [Maritalea myrionectae]|uniref:Cysteine/O-acetylserine efflux protein n=2 Tax=Maritalea myrionectae TaxID=454601 RepID=A0A2R4MA99_9HYPH|nr:LysE family translocator [Maritalea myrionectae]AVX02903.1 cysteine/O-acetylserine efflux protein [Maritalea myrionectae]